MIARDRARLHTGLPVGEAVELDDIEAQRALFDDFGLLECPPTQPMPLELEVIEVDRTLSQVRRAFGQGGRRA